MAPIDIVFLFLFSLIRVEEKKLSFLKDNIGIINIFLNIK